MVGRRYSTPTRYPVRTIPHESDYSRYMTILRRTAARRGSLIEKNSQQNDLDNGIGFALRGIDSLTGDTLLQALVLPGRYQVHAHDGMINHAQPRYRTTPKCMGYASGTTSGRPTWRSSDRQHRLRRSFDTTTVPLSTWSSAAGAQPRSTSSCSAGSESARRKARTARFPPWQSGEDADVLGPTGVWPLVPK